MKKNRKRYYIQDLLEISPLSRRSLYRRFNDPDCRGYIDTDGNWFVFEEDLDPFMMTKYVYNRKKKAVTIDDKDNPINEEAPKKNP